jgi:hypothetical protein
VQRFFIEAFRRLKRGEFYDGWCALERAEIELSFLLPHMSEGNREFHLELMARLIPRLQSLFPYKIFASPEILELAKVCSICQKQISIRRPCGHRVGEIYGGEMCIRIVTDLKFLGVAMVKSPVQKYSVVFLPGNDGNSRDHYDYSLVKFLADRLESPFHDWDVQWTRIRHPHSRFAHIGRNDDCPCESGKKYKKCCLPESGVLRPHAQLTFSVQPPINLPSFEYSA